MQPVRRLYLDTNIFIAAYEWRNETSGQILNLLKTGFGLKFVSSELTLSELLVSPYKRKDGDLIDTYESIFPTSDWLEVIPVNRETLRYAAVLRSGYAHLKLPDAIHISTAIGAACSHIITGDFGIKGTYSLIKLLFEDAPEDIPLTVIRPDEPTLTSLLQSLAP